MDMTQEKVFT